MGVLALISADGGTRCEYFRRESGCVGERKLDRPKMRQPPGRARSLIWKKQQVGEQDHRPKMTVFPSILCLARCVWCVFRTGAWLPFV